MSQTTRGYAGHADAYGLRVMVQGMDGAPRVVDFRRGVLAKMAASKIRGELLDAGLRTESGGEKIAVNALKAVDPEHEIILVSRPGCHRLADLADPIFVTPGGEVLGVPGKIVLELSANHRPAMPTSRGTIEDWRAAIARAISLPG